MIKVDFTEKERDLITVSSLICSKWCFFNSFDGAVLSVIIKDSNIKTFKKYFSESVSERTNKVLTERESGTGYTIIVVDQGFNLLSVKHEYDIINAMQWVNVVNQLGTFI